MRSSRWPAATRWCGPPTSTPVGPHLLIGLLEAYTQQLLYIPGRIVHHAAATYCGDGKTDAKDARIIADQTQMRRDLHLLTTHRTDLTYDRVRMINRLRALLLDYFPALEAAFDYSKKAPLTLLTGYAAPDALRRLAQCGWRRGCAPADAATARRWPTRP